LIGLFIKIPFHAQIRASDRRLADELAERVNATVAAFDASEAATDESFLLTFDESSRPCRLRAAEAARRLSAKLSELGPRLHGWAVILDSRFENPDEALRISKLLWFSVQDDGLYVAARSKSYFADYFLFGPQDPAAEPEGKLCVPVLDSTYARRALPEADMAYETQPSAVEKIVDALSALGIGQAEESALAVLGPGRGPSLCLKAALEKLYGEATARFLRLRASVVEEAPYGPIASAFAALVSPKRGVSGPGALLSGSERGLLEELAPMLDFLIRSPYRRGYSRRIGVRLRLCIAAALRFYMREMRTAGLPAFIILEGLERFPEPSLSLILGLAADSLSGEGITILALGTALSEAWSGPAPRRVEVEAPSPADIAQAALGAAQALKAPGASVSLALAAAGDPQRLRLALRILASGKSVSPTASTESLAVEALSTFPREYTELLLSLKLCEEVLTDECAESFLRDSGYSPGLREPVYDALARLGFVTAEARPRMISAEASSRIETILPDGGAALRSDFAKRILSLREEGRILPSYALFRRMKAADAPTEFKGESSLVLDCIATDAIYGPSDPPLSDPLGTSLESLADFLRTYAEGLRDPCLEALSRLEAASSQVAEDKLVSATASLARAAFEYAEGRAQDAASLAKYASIGFHALDAGKAEAKAHRILGFCALALSQVQEGADYLSNAFELASACPEPLESILSAIGEAAAAFVLGDLGKAASKADSAAAWAGASFRADWEAAAAFIKGRAALEIGRYAEAEDSFGRVRAIARVYGQAEAARRAEIWTGRAAAFAGESLRARDILGRFDADAEALWFLAELELWEASPEKASVLAAEALSLVPGPRFSPADSFDWDSGFSSLEGRAVGFLGGRSYLRDQVEAFGEFAAGMASPEKEVPARAERLASMAREDRLASLHPAAHLYLFYRYLLLERASPSSMDGAAALSKAFKALQTRSTRMGEASLKDGFLESNRWNRALLAAARARKLI
jgi:hypothetical protein